MSADIQDIQPFAEAAADMLKALAHPARLLLVCQLLDREMSVGALEAALGVKQPNLSRELAKLRAQGILATRRESKVVFYRLADPRAAAVVNTLCAVFLGQPQPSAVTVVVSPKPNTQPVGGHGVFARTDF